MRSSLVFVMFLCVPCCYALNERDEQILYTIDEMGSVLIHHECIGGAEFNAMGTRVEQLLQTEYAPLIATNFESLFGASFLMTRDIIDVWHLWDIFKNIVARFFDQSNEHDNDRLYERQRLVDQGFPFLLADDELDAFNQI